MRILRPPRKSAGFAAAGRSECGTMRHLQIHR
jgi:hypothetical protein